jgi:uncharacterized Ntn-hydrolase superfamily protein
MELPLIVIIAALALSTARAQHTFSIVAVDPSTGEVGSAGASCISVDAVLISDVHPGVGALHTQAFWVAANQDYGMQLMSDGLGPDAIIDSLTHHDAQGLPEMRQYGAVVLAGGGRSAAYTGTGCLDYKGHVTGPTYSIQGNTLLGPAIIDSMRARFLREPGTLADKLMAALQGANVIGADTRCAPNSSSHAAFLRVARPGDAEDKLTIELHVVLGDSPREPIDSLQILYSRWKASASGVPGSGRAGGLRMEINPNPAAAAAVLRYTIAAAAPVRLAVYDLAGHAVLDRAYGMQPAGSHEVTLGRDGLAAGTYYCRLTAGDEVVTKQLVLVAGGD